MNSVSVRGGAQEQTVIKNNMFFPRDINDIVMRSDPLNGLAKEIISDRKRSGKKLFFLIRRDNVTVSLDAGFDSNRGYREFTAETTLKLVANGKKELMRSVLHGDSSSRTSSQQLALF